MRRRNGIQPVDLVKLFSTRSQEQKSVSFGTALLQGRALDGGLYVPDDFVHIDSGLYLRTESFRSCAESILSQILTGGNSVDPGSAFEISIPLVPLGGSYAGIHVLELFHGPTAAFKDIGSRWLASAMSQHVRSRPIVLVATSGDTGSAVADAFSTQTQFRVVLLYPKGGVNRVQEMQLCQPRQRVSAFCVDGPFDACDKLVDYAFANLRDYGLTSANSVNIGRVLPQMTYYFWAAKQLGQAATFVVPSGNLGNLTAGLYATLFGLQTSGFIAAQNANNALTRYLKFKELRDDVETIRTIANAMDIAEPQNLERILFHFSYRQLASLVSGDTATDADIRKSIKHVFEETGYLADPHTAIALRSAHKLHAEKRPAVVLATADPAKYPELLESVTGQTPRKPAALDFPNEMQPVEIIKPEVSEMTRILSSLT